MYIIVKDPWGSYVDGRPIEERELVEAFAKSKSFTTQETDKEPVIDMTNSPIRSWDASKLITPIQYVTLEELKEQFPSKPVKKKSQK